ncbi:glycosyltransferase family 2 protein [Providencia rettgeri]
MKFSVIIPLYNKEFYIKKTIQSVLSQSFQDFEIIIVDDGSTDNSVDEARKIIDSRISIIKQKNNGVSSARNNGIKHATGDFLIFLDADDIFLSHAFEHFAQLIDTYKENYFFCTNYYRVSNSGKSEAINVNKILGPDFQHAVIDNFFYIASFHPGSFPCCVSTFCINRKLLIEKKITFPEGVTHTEDIYFCSLLALNFKPVFSKECIYEYHINTIGNSRESRPTDERFIISELKKIEKKEKWIDSFITKNIIHLIYNCLEFNNYQNYKKHIIDPYFKYRYTVGSYKFHYLILKILPYSAAKSLYLYIKSRGK